MRYEMLHSVVKSSVFQPFSSRGTLETLLNVWWNLDTKNNINFSILKERRKQWTEPLGSAEPRLKNNVIEIALQHSYKRILHGGGGDGEGKLKNKKEGERGKE